MKPETLHQLHQVEIEILDEIVRICENNNLRYFLIGGTLLGAVRHRGFIPWDDDLDIAMPRTDYEMFEKLCKTELQEKYYVHSSETDKNYWLPFMKIRKHNTAFDEARLENADVSMNGIWVDIFPLDNAKKLNSFGKRIRTTIIKKNLQHFIVYKRHKRWPHPFLSKLVFVIAKPVSIYRLRKIQDWFMKFDNNKDCPYYINFGSKYDPIHQTILKTDYEPSYTLEFEGKIYSVPGNYQNILIRIYGSNYMQLPPKEKQVTHNPVRLSFDTNGPDETLD